jgi:hypothetical protein
MTSGIEPSGSETLFRANGEEHCGGIGNVVRGLQDKEAHEAGQAFSLSEYNRWRRLTSLTRG